MEGSRSKGPPQPGKSCSRIDAGWEEIIISFGRFGLGKDGTLASQPDETHKKNAGSSSSLSDSAEKDNNFLPVSEVSLEKKECSSQVNKIDELQNRVEADRPPALSLQEDVWVQRNIYNGLTLGENHRSSIQDQIASVPNYQSDVYHSGNRTLKNYFPAMGGHFSCDHFSQIRNAGHYMNNNIASPTYPPYQVLQNSSLQQENYLLMMASTRDGSEKLQKVLQQGNYYLIQEVLNGVLGSVFGLMIDDNGHHVFRMLIEKCLNDQLYFIVSKVEREPDTFIHIAFTDKGSKSIQRLIKRLKKTPMAKTITRILSERSCELLTHKIGSHVIRQCFVLLGEEPNLILYKAIGPHLLDLAIDQVGCISLNNLLDSITGERRRMFLYYLAEHSLFLANDPSGNFVVQHMLSLNNEQVTKKILERLQGNFGRLAQKQGGSHVVEKCIGSSESGLRQVVLEILRERKELFRLARDQFGNYVIQTALKQTKMMISEETLYPQLLRALEPYYPHLLGKTRGRHVAELIKEDLGLQKAKADE